MKNAVYYNEVAKKVNDRKTLKDTYLDTYFDTLIAAVARRGLYETTLEYHETYDRVIEKLRSKGFKVTITKHLFSKTEMTISWKKQLT